MAGSSKLWREALGDAFGPGDVLVGKYCLERIVGLGGMGVIVEARHTGLEEKVAVKLLRPSRRTSEKARARFIREARAAFKITSEHVARVFDLGALEDGTVYMVMEYLEGHDLAQLLVSSGRLRADTAVGYVLQACQAVAEAHALGIVHRDLKPENLFLCRRADGTPCIKVLDFGLAKVTRRSQSLTRVNRGMGTPRYMAPEQWVSARDVGPAADIWAFGVILYELVSGVAPFDDPDVKKLAQDVLAQRAPKLSSCMPGADPGLEAVIARCLQKKPAHRYANVADLAADLLAHAPQGPRERIDEVVRRSRSLPPPRTSWGLSLSEASDSTPWLDATLASLPDDDATDEDETLLLEIEAPVSPPPTTQGSGAAETTEKLAAPRPKRSMGAGLGLLALVALLAGVLLAFATFDGDAQPIDAPAALDSAPPAASPAPVHDSPPPPTATAAVDESLDERIDEPEVEEQPSEPAPRPRVRWTPRPRPRPAPPPEPPEPSQPSGKWVPTEP